MTFSRQLSYPCVYNELLHALGLSMDNRKETLNSQVFFVLKMRVWWVLCAQSSA